MEKFNIFEGSTITLEEFAHTMIEEGVVLLFTEDENECGKHLYNRLKKEGYDAYFKDGVGVNGIESELYVNKRYCTYPTWWSIICSLTKIKYKNNEELTKFIIKNSKYKINTLQSNAKYLKDKLDNRKITFANQDSYEDLYEETNKLLNDIGDILYALIHKGESLVEEKGEE